MVLCECAVLWDLEYRYVKGRGFGPFGEMSARVNRASLPSPDASDAVGQGVHNQSPSKSGPKKHGRPSKGALLVDNSSREFLAPLPLKLAAKPRYLYTMRSDMYRSCAPPTIFAATVFS